MSLAVQRDPAAVAAGIERWLAADRGTPMTVTRCERPGAGLSSDTLMVDAHGSDVRSVEHLVVRLAPVQGIFPEYDLAAQARVQEAAAAGGVPTAVPARFEPDPAWVGAPFLVMPAIDGHIPGAMPLHDRWVTETEETAGAVSRALVDLLVAIHAIDWQAAGLAGVVPVRDVDAELAYWSSYLGWFADGDVAVPGLVRAFDWCVAHRPAADPPPALLWGDVRLGNVIFGDDREPVAVLDWEMATVGAPEHDLAWYLTLEATQRELLGRDVPGFLGADELCARYEAGAGRALQSLPWFEVLAMLRSTAIMSRLAWLEVRAGRSPMLPLADNPLLDLLARRVTEAGR